MFKPQIGVLFAALKLLPSVESGSLNSGVSENTVQIRPVAGVPEAEWGEYNVWARGDASHVQVRRLQTDLEVLLSGRAFVLVCDPRAAALGAHRAKAQAALATLRAASAHIPIVLLDGHRVTCRS